MKKQLSVVLQVRPYLLDLGLGGRRDGCRGDELEGGRGVVWVLSWKLDDQVNLMAAEVSRHHAASVQRVHLRATRPLPVSRLQLLILIID